MDAIVALLSMDSVGTAGLLIVLFVLLATGKIATGRELKDAKEREAIKDQTIDKLRSALVETTENDRTIVNLLQEIKRIANERAYEEGNGGRSL